jgi:hypothetical protein
VTEGTIDPQEWKDNLLIELPSGIVVFGIILIWANLVTVLRLNAGRIRESLGLDSAFFKRWKAPEILLWPTIVGAALMLFAASGTVGATVGINLFKCLMAVYAIQGLSILSFIFDAWHIRGFFRSAAFIMAVFLMMPLVLSLGFFDTWFDFRSKFRQSS